MDLELGTNLFDNYRIERVLGKGWASSSWLNLELEDKFAINVLTGELDADGQQRFLREARDIARSRPRCSSTCHRSRSRRSIRTRSRSRRSSARGRGLSRSRERARAVRRHADVRRDLA